MPREPCPKRYKPSPRRHIRRPQRTPPPDNAGAPQLARAINRDYIDSRITAIINWNLVTAYYKTVPHWGNSLMVADQPWSGAFALGKSIWVSAHTTQFAQPGWQYLNGASGYLEGNRSRGSFVTLRSPNRRDYSTASNYASLEEAALAA